MTDAEQWLWHKVRRKQILGIQFNRQRPIGPYIVDFYAPRVNLVVEIDGGQHFAAQHAEHDRRRDAYLRRQGLVVLRFDNLRVLKEGQAVLEAIWGHCERVRVA
jgi:very-short-patch-repair endonuclease